MREMLPSYEDGAVISYDRGRPKLPRRAQNWIPKVRCTFKGKGQPNDSNTVLYLLVSGHTPYKFIKEECNGPAFWGDEFQFNWTVDQDVRYIIINRLDYGVFFLFVNTSLCTSPKSLNEGPRSLNLAQKFRTV